MTSNHNTKKQAHDCVKGPPVVADKHLFPLDYDPGETEAKKSYTYRLQSGFLHRFLSGDIVLDIGPKGGTNPTGKTAVPHAIGIDLDYPGYDGIALPFGDESVDAVFSSHCMEHVWFAHKTLQEHFRVTKIGGFIVMIVPHQFLYEKRLFLPSIFNPDHKRMFTPATLLSLVEEALDPNTYRVRHLCDNDRFYDYSIPPEKHAFGCYEIELVLERIAPPVWTLVG